MSYSCPVRPQRCELLSTQPRSLDAHSVLMRPRGEIDGLTAPLLKQVLDHQQGRHPRVALELVDIWYFGRCGLAVLERAQQRARGHRTEFRTIAPYGHMATRMAAFISTEVNIRLRDVNGGGGVAAWVERLPEPRSHPASQ